MNYFSIVAVKIIALDNNKKKMVEYIAQVHIIISIVLFGMFCKHGMFAGTIIKNKTQVEQTEK